MLAGYLQDGPTKLQSAPAAERNKDPILDVLKQILPSEFDGGVLEVASGTGQHVTHFAKNFPSAYWHPTEYDPSLLSSISAYIQSNDLHNVNEPFKLDASQPFQGQGDLKPEAMDLIICTNLVHISPWNVTEGLFRGSGQVLKVGGQLLTYGPYAVDGLLKPDSNVRFDQSLRSRDPSWGIRDIRDLQAEATKHGLSFDKTFEMPANNKCLLFTKH